MEEGSIHNSDGPGFHRIIDWQYFDIGISSMDLINELGDIGSNKIMIAILGIQTNFSVLNLSIWYIHVIFDFSNSGSSWCIDVIEIVLETDT